MQTFRLCNCRCSRNRGLPGHIDLGRRLASLRDDGVLILGSGSLTHNLRALNQTGRVLEAPVQPWVAEFTDWIAEQGDIRRRGRHSRLSRAPRLLRRRTIPTMSISCRCPLPWVPEDGGKGKRVHASYEYGILAMDTYRV